MAQKQKFYKGKIIDIPSTEGMSIINKLKFIIKELIYCIRYYFQRGRNGYSHLDVYDISDWFSRNIVNIIDDLINNTNSYPGYDGADTFEKWIQILQYMKFCFQESREDTCSQKNEIEYPELDIIINDDNSISFPPNEQFDKWSQREKELVKYRETMLNQGLDLFKKWYYDLWD